MVSRVVAGRSSRARQQRPDQPLLQRGHPTLAARASKAQPATPDALDADAADQRPMAPTPQTHAPLPQRAIRRHHPRQEPSALTRTLGSARGAARKGGPYRD